MEKIFIVIPAYNEEKRIGATLEEYSKFFDELQARKIIDYELVIVINNTKDKTEEIVRGIQKKNKRIRYLNFKRGGKGFAITEGFKEALKDERNSIIGFVDADMATSPYFFYGLVKNIRNYGGAVANRYMRGSKINLTFKRRMISRVFNLVVRTLFMMNYSDTQCGAKIFRRKILEKIVPELGMTAWAFDIDLLYRCKKNKIRIRQVPTVWHEKKESKMDIKKDSIKMFMAVFQLRILNSPFRRFWKIVNLIAGLFWRVIK